MSCPSCNQEITLKGLSSPIANELRLLISLKKRVEKLALENAEKQGILAEERLTTVGDRFYGKP